MEAPALLRGILGADDRHRSADVLCIPALALARALPDGSRAVRTERVCFDFGVINALGPDHWVHTSVEGGAAADRYGESKRRRNDTERVCAESGLQYRPIIHEAQGGTSKQADAAIGAVSCAVAAAEGKESQSIRSEMLARIAAVQARCNAQAIRQRRQKAQTRTGSWAVRAQLRLGPALYE